MSQSIFTVEQWDVNNIQYMKPKVNDKFAKSIGFIDKTTYRAIALASPIMMTWGIADFVDPAGDSNGKYSISLNFPNENTKSTDEFLAKLVEFETKLLKDAVINSVAWFGKSLSADVINHMFSPVINIVKIKIQKNLI